MTNERKDLIISKIDAVYAAVRELGDINVATDIHWAEQLYEKNDGANFGDDDDIVFQLIHLRQDLKDLVQNMI